MKRGNLIVFTGIDGSGKTTQAELLIKDFHDNRQRASYVWSRWKPFLVRPVIRKWKSKTTGKKHILNEGTPELKDKKQSLLNNPLVRWLWLTSFFVDYGLQIFIKIRIKLMLGHLMVSDRIYIDSIIDQAVNLGERGESLLNNLDSFWVKVIFPSPNLIIYIDCPPEVAFSRKEEADIEYLEERRKLYLRLADEHKWIIIDGTLPVQEIFEKVRQEVKEII